MSKERWQVHVDPDVDKQLRTIKRREGYDTKSETANEVLKEGLESYRTGLTARILDKAALIAAFGAVMAFLLFLNSGSWILIKSAALLGVSGIACSIGSLFNVGTRELNQQEPKAVADGGRAGDDG